MTVYDFLRSRPVTVSLKSDFGKLILNSYNLNIIALNSQNQE